MDIELAHRIAPVHPQDRLLFRVHWQGTDYIDAVLPFGLHSAPKIFTALADALQWVLQDRGVTFFWQYINDSIVCGPPCILGLPHILTICDSHLRITGPAPCKAQIWWSCNTYNNLGYSN